MLTPARLAIAAPRQRGISMIEVLVTLVVLAFGLLGLAALESKTQLLDVESYQRAQAVLLLQEMTERMYANSPSAASYVTTTTLGTGDSQPTDCTSLAVGAARDQCDWSNNLKGAAETLSGNNAGAMIGARGCITQIQAPDNTPGTCIPGIYQVAVAWQGTFPTTAPAVACGQNSYGTDTYRRLVSQQVTIGVHDC